MRPRRPLEIVRQIDDSGKQTATLSEVAVAISGQVSEQTAELLARVARFRLADDIAAQAAVGG